MTFNETKTRKRSRSIVVGVQSLSCVQSRVEGGEKSKSSVWDSLSLRWLGATPGERLKRPSNAGLKRLEMPKTITIL